MTLTIADIKNAKIKDRTYKLTDSHGLFLQVSPAGTKSWRFKYRHGGKERLLSFGRYPQIGLAAARVARDDARDLLLEGKDPVLEKRRERQRKLDAAEATFRRVADEWLSDHAPLWSLSNATRVRNRFERDLYPVFGSTPIGAGHLRRTRRHQSGRLQAAEVVGIFPNEAAITRLVGTILMEQSDECAVERARYMTLETMAPLSDNPIIMLSAVPGT